MFAILVALTITVSGVPVNGTDFLDGAVGSVKEEETEKIPDKDGNADNEEQGEDSAFQSVENDKFSEDEISVFTDEGEDTKAAGNADAAQISDGTGEKENSEEEKGTEGLEYEYLPETDSYRVTKGVNAETVIILSEYNGKAVTEIGEGAFSGCDKIQKVFFKGTAMQHITIRQKAFENCVNLIEVYSNSYYVWNIESNAFKNCPRLVNVGNYMMPDQREDGGMIADDAFDPDSRVVVTGWGSLPYRKDGYPFYYSDIEEPEYLDGEDGMTYLEWGTYNGIDEAHAGYRIISCDDQKETVRVTGNKGDIIGVGRKAFYGNEKIKVLNLGKTVKYIETKAFYCCKNLQKIYIPSATKEIAEDAFDGCSSLTIYTSEGSYAAKYAEAHHIPVSYSDKNIKNEKIKLRASKVEKEDEYELMYGIRLKWNQTESADGYQIQKKADGEKYSTCFDINDRNICTKMICPGIENAYYGKDMSFRVRAYFADSDGKKHYTSYSSVKVSFWPEQPEITSLTKKSGNKVTVRWKKTKYTDGYEVWRSENGKPFVCVKKINSKNAHSFTDTDLKKGVRYTYSIKSYRVNYQNRKVYGDIFMRAKRGKIKY